MISENTKCTVFFTILISGVPIQSKKKSSNQKIDQFVKTTTFCMANYKRKMEYVQDKRYLQKTY